MSTVAVVGLGDLGLACGLRLHELGLDPIGVDPAPERQAQWRSATGMTAAAAIAEPADRILLCVRTTAQAQSVLDDLAARRWERPATVYVITTLEPAFARSLADVEPDRLRVIELPVSGGRRGARDGTLTVMAGGRRVEPSDVDFLSRTIAGEVYAFARFGDATVVKLLNNAVGAYNAAAFAWALIAAEREGIDPALCAGVIRSASGSSWMAERFATLVDDLLAKDASLLARELGPLPPIDLSDADAFLAVLAAARALVAARP